MSRTPTLAEVLREAVRAQLAAVRVALPARVEAYDAAKQTVDVKPMIKEVLADADGQLLVESLPVVPGVPVVFPRGGGYFVSFPLAAGDFVLLVVADRSIDQWLAKGSEADPGDLRQHDLSDAVAIPGVYPATAPLADAHPDNLVVGRDGGGQIHVLPNGEVHIGQLNPPAFAADASKADARFGALEQWLATHTHPTGVGPSGPPVQPLTPGQTVAATKVKVL